MAITKASNSGIKTGVLKYDSMLAGNAAYEPSSVDSIATVTVGSGGSSTVEFTSIPGTYTHLQVRCITRTASGSFLLRMQFNGDTASNYSRHSLYGDGGSMGADALANSDNIYSGYSNDTANTSIFGVNIIDILDYANTNKYKTARCLIGFDYNGGGSIALTSGNWRNTNAITSIKFYFSSGTFAQYSHFALYGIKAVS